MKYKYFLRGLGIGIILSALILCISYRSSGSNENIVDQAKELGMVFPEGTQPPETVDEITPTATPADTPRPTQNSSGAGVTGEEPENTVKPEVTASPKATASPRVTAKPKRTKKPASAKSDGTGVEFKVR